MNAYDKEIYFLNGRIQNEDFKYKKLFEKFFEDGRIDDLEIHQKNFKHVNNLIRIVFASSNSKTIQENIDSYYNDNIVDCSIEIQDKLNQELDLVDIDLAIREY